MVAKSVVLQNLKNQRHVYAAQKYEQEAQLMLTTGSTRLAISRGQQTWYHFESIATFR